MPHFLIEGNRRLKGEVCVQGAKNSILSILAATVLCSGQCIIHNCPDILDVDFSIEILKYLGGFVYREGKSIIVNMENIKRYDIPDRLMKEMRSSIIFLGAIISRLKKAQVSLPGGCQLGPRPIDFHLEALKNMGVQIHEDGVRLFCIVKEKLQGTKIVLPFPSVGATENIILAATLASGETILENAAREPEIEDLIRFLNLCGAKIKGAGTSKIAIKGVPKLTGAEYKIIPDRIAAATYMAAGAITGGEVLVRNISRIHLNEIVKVLKMCKCGIIMSGENLLIKAPERLTPIKKLKTAVYPGFPTDMQALILSMMTVAKGKSSFEENVFSDRYKYTKELLKMGAQIYVNGKNAIVEGVEQLHAADMAATDLRGGAALVLAGLKAQGISSIRRLRHIDRGYEKLEENLSGLGAKIKRIS
ncbi:MAG: UDP-N-acetylglucosamine 1-carboxyvinyltransferase [Clostridia bacterium]|nr:UDP-N-acetylglucosamine 1-carboxyvinyltransferase [Clostridia bacterium]